MKGKGLYRTTTPETGAEYAFVDYGVPSDVGEIPRARYEENGYQPPFDDLPTKSKYQQSKVRPRSANVVAFKHRS